MAREKENYSFHAGKRDDTAAERSRGKWRNVCITFHYCEPKIFRIFSHWRSIKILYRQSCWFLKASDTSLLQSLPSLLLAVPSPFHELHLVSAYCRGLELDDLKDPFQLKQFYDSITCKSFMRQVSWSVEEAEAAVKLKKPCGICRYRLALSLLHFQCFATPLVWGQLFILQSFQTASSSVPVHSSLFNSLS